jgi:hypothetical protein
MKNCWLGYQGIDVATWIDIKKHTGLVKFALDSSNLNAVHQFTHLLHIVTNDIKTLIFFNKVNTLNDSWLFNSPIQLQTQC